MLKKDLKRQAAALASAVRVGDAEGVRMLLEANADVSAAHNKGITALIGASSSDASSQIDLAKANADLCS